MGLVAVLRDRRCESVRERTQQIWSLNEMSNDSSSKLDQELQQTIGAVGILDILREEFEQWLEEAQDESKHEALENVLGHIEVLDTEYKRRRTELQGRLEGNTT